MKKLLAVCSLVVMLVGVTVFNAAAAPINGDISFSGGVVFSNTAFTSFYDVQVTQVNGDYGTVPIGNATNPVVTFTPFSFNPVSAPAPLWSFSYNGDAYGFDTTSMVVITNESDAKGVRGAGNAMITGFDVTPGTWIVQASQSGGSFSFQSTNAAHGVPEPGTLLLLGFGLVGLVGAARRRMK